MKDDNIVGWFSLENGQHVPLREGESKREATSKFLNKKMSRTEKNKEKYNKIDGFKKKKKSNNKIEKKSNDDEDFGRKVVGLRKENGRYIPIREGDKDEQGKNSERERQEKSAERIQQKVGSRLQSGVNWLNFGDKELDNQIKDAVENKASKDDIKRIINDYKEKKMSNRLRATASNDSEMAKLEKERYDLKQDIEALTSTTYSYSSPIEDVKGNLKSMYSNLSSKETSEVNQKQERIYDIERRQNQILRTSERKGISNNSIETDIIKPFGTTQNLVKELDKQRLGNEDIYRTAERYVRSGNYLNNYEDIEDYLIKKVKTSKGGRNYSDTSSYKDEKSYYEAYVGEMARRIENLYKKHK